MQTSMSLEQLLSEVQRQDQVKRDFITNTEDQLQLVLAGNKVYVDLLISNNEFLDRLEISENAHRQVATWLKVPTKYYFRLLKDHPDLIVGQVNELFRREPGRRMCRVLDNTVRAFLSDRYERIDNAEILSNTLPTIIKGDVETTLLSSNVNLNRMDVKVLFTDKKLGHEVSRVRGEPRIIRPGFRMSNSEVGGGSFNIEAFFFDSYCTNGCVFGKENLFNFSQRHIGGRISEDHIDNLEIISDRTRKLENDLIVSQITDAVDSLSNPESIEKMANFLKETANTDPVKNPIAAVDAVAKEVTLRESEKDRMLEVFLRDQDYTKWGMASAITEIANDSELVSYDRANEIENIGGKVLNLADHQWQKFVNVERVA